MVSLGSGLKGQVIGYRLTICDRNHSLQFSADLRALDVFDHFTSPQVQVGEVVVELVHHHLPLVLFLGNNSGIAACGVKNIKISV